MLETLYLKVDTNNPEKAIIERAVNLLQKGELIAFPTETVYGVGAVVSNPKAVQEIFRIKNRPANNPLLVHISNMQQVEMVVETISPLALKLMESFWPGPLSLIMPAHKNLAPIVTGGQSAVGLRMPSHPIAQILIEGAGALAATSANLSGHFSPTTAHHVQDDLAGKIAAIIDGGPTGIGIESTIIDLSSDIPKVLRLGGLALEEIEATMGMKLDYVASTSKADAIYLSDMKIILSPDEARFFSEIDYYIKLRQKIGIVYNNYFSIHNINDVDKEYMLNLSQPSIELFSILRDAEQAKLEVLVFVTLLDDLTGVNQALLERIRKL